MQLTHRALSIILLIFSLNAGAQKQTGQKDTDSTCYRALAFGQYLLQSGQYQIASTEFERLLYYCPELDTIRYYLLKANRLAGRFTMNNNWYQTWSQNELSLSLSTRKEYVYSSLAHGNYEPQHYQTQGRSIIADDSAFKNNLDLGLHILRNEWSEARLKASHCSSCNESLLRLSNNTAYLSMKKPFTAAGLSLLVPGMGKAYVGDWKDGIFSLLFTVSNGYASYRGFRNNGVQSAYGWIFGAIGGGFYLGNIYGAAKAAKKHNAAIQTKIHEETLDLLVPPF